MSKYIFLKKKIILGKTKKIYTKKESKKEYVKYKNCMINIAKYKKIKNNKGKKMKGGARGPSLFRKKSVKFAPHDQEKLIPPKEDNLADLMSGLKIFSRPGPNSVRRPPSTYNNKL
jgi:hypothetical protein